MPATATPGLKDRLKSIRAEIEGARDDRKAALTDREAAREAFAAVQFESASEMTRAPEFEAAEKAVAKVGALDDKLADLQEAEKVVLGMLGEQTPAASQSGNGNGPADGQQASRGWSARALLQSDQAQAFLSSWQATSSGSIRASLGQLASRDDVIEFYGAVGSDNKQGAIPADRRGIIAPYLRNLSLLDLIPFGATDSNSVDYVQVTSIPNAARPTAEGRLKPEASMTTRDVSAPVRTIPAFIKVLRQALQDVAGLETLLNGLLPYDVRRALESQILLGDGEGQNLLGLLNTTGIGDPTPVRGDNNADAILRAMTVILLGNGQPNFTALNPLVWQELLLMRENQAERTGMYLYGSPASVTAPTIWGLPITTNAAVPADQTLVGDSMGATVLVREGINVRVTDTDQDDFVNNRVTIRAEGRFAFAVWRPDSFAVAKTSGPASAGGSGSGSGSGGGSGSGSGA